MHWSHKNNNYHFITSPNALGSGIPKGLRGEVVALDLSSCCSQIGTGAEIATYWTS